VILLAVRWYLRYGLSYRDAEELLAERWIEVDHVTIYR
jgi:IS6 family transposase